MSTVIATVIALPYEIARTPLAAVDRRLSQLLPETSGPRVALDKAIGTADRLAGTVLLNSDIARRGSERLERTEARLAEARVEAEMAAAAAREQQEAAAEAHEIVEAAEEAYRIEEVKETAAAEREATRAPTAELRKERVAEVMAEKRAGGSSQG